MTAWLHAEITRWGVTGATSLLLLPYIAGAIVGSYFSCNGTFDFHYDLALNKPRNLAPVTVKSWAEL